MTTTAATFEALRDLITTTATTATPLAMELKLHPKYIETPALRLISDQLHAAITKPDGRLILSVPPQEGKTELVRAAIVKALRDQPDLRVILGSYNQSIASHGGAAIKNLIEANPDLGLRIAGDTRAKAEWKIAGHNGGLVARGRGSGVAGRAADCVRGDMHIVCEYGRLTAADAFSRGITRILAYDHTAGRTVWRNVEAARRIDSRPTLEITTEAGRVLVCTPDHRVHTGRGYVPAGDLRRGDTLVAVMDADRVPMRDRLSATASGPAKSDHPQVFSLLHAPLHGGDVRDCEPDELLRLRGSHPAKQETHVLQDLRADPASSVTPEDALPRVWDRVSAQVAPNAVLRENVRRSGALAPDDREGELALQDGHELRQMVPVDATHDPGAGRQGLRGLSAGSDDELRPQRRDREAVGAGGSPHQRTAVGQPCGEPDHALPRLPHDAPQVTSDTVRLVRASSDGPVAVYDFQVEGTSNFFAGGVLVHNCLIIDDPFKEGEAQSETIRNEAWTWYREGLATRLSPGASVVLIMCMTGDTAVLLPDGTEKPLRDVRPGDEVATYEDGGLSVATVRNWANQGPDDLFRVMMKSGRVVRANARHPFLSVDANGVETWLRTDQIRPGVSILTATGESGVALSAPSTDATNLHAARGCVTPTTARPAGPLGTGRLRSTLRHVVELASSTATVSRMRKWTSSSLSRVASALSAASPRPTRTPEPTGAASSASTTTTTPARCADSSATTAISQSDTARRQKLSGQPLTTWSITPDEVVAVESCGREDVYDVQIDRTENFIANGLVSHNTRWHSDDLVGRLIEQDAHAGWTVVNIPAQCDDPDTDPLGRAYGEFLLSARGRTREQWEQRKLTAGSQTWNALYQGRPSPAEGGLVKRDWWQRYATPLWEEHPDGTCWAAGFDELIMSADLTFKGTANADRVAIGVWGRRGVHAYLLDITVGRMEFVPTVAAFAKLAAKWPQATLKLVEDKANGPALMSMLAKRIPGIVPYDPGRIGKVPRLLAVAPLIEAGNVHIPTDSLASWADEYVEEHAGFPNAAHDDLVDMTSQALDRLLVRPLSQLGTTVTDGDDYDDWRIGY